MWLCRCNNSFRKFHIGYVFWFDSFVMHSVSFLNLISRQHTLHLKLVKYYENLVMRSFCAVKGFSLSQNEKLWNQQKATDSFAESVADCFQKAISTLLIWMASFLFCGFGLDLLIFFFFWASLEVFLVHEHFIVKEFFNFLFISYIGSAFFMYYIPDLRRLSNKVFDLWKKEKEPKFGKH